MKKVNCSLVHWFIGSLVCCIILPTLCIGQDWKWLNPLPQGNFLTSIKFVNKDTGYAVGKFGTIIKTGDGGENWIVQKSGTANHLNSLFLIDKNTAYAAGDTGLILKTIDGGNNWTKQNCQTTEHFESVFFPKPDTGYAIGIYGNIYKTTNAGNSWEEIYETMDLLYSSYFINTNIGFVVGEFGDILKTTDGGKTWLNHSPVASSELYFQSITFKDSLNGFVSGFDYNAGEGLILKTNDGGNSWTISKELVDFYPYDMCFIDKNYGFVLGGGGSLQTTNGGDTWIARDSIKGFVCYFVDKQIGYTATVAIDKTINGGKSWDKQTKSITDEHLHSVFATDTNTLYIVSENGSIIKTSDGGITWIKQYKDSTDFLTSVYFVNDSVGFVTSGYGNIISTKDGGKNWLKYNIGTKNYLYSVYFIDVNIGFVSGENGILLKTIDSGMNWISSNSGTNGDIYQVYFINKDVGFITGCGGWIYKTVDGGNKWTSSSLQNTQYGFCLSSIYFLNSNIGYAVGGYVFKTTDGGDNWKILNIGAQIEVPKLVYFIDSETGYISGYSNSTGTFIFKTTDGGNTWTENKIYIYCCELKVLFTNSKIGYAVGEMGTILKTIKGGGIFTGKNEVINQKSKIKIEIYPNPVNEQAIISYQLSEKSLIEMKLYDLLGNEVSTLLNGEKERGVYNIKYNTGNLKRGMYFIKLNCNQEAKVTKFIKE